MSSERADALRIFLNYRREDTSSQAHRLYDDLAERFGRRGIFVDIDSLEGGSDFATSIDEALAECDVVISLIGKRWLSAVTPDGARRLDRPDDWVRAELERALSLPQIRVIPALVDGASMPSPHELPETLSPLARRHALDLRETHWQDDTGRLLSLLESIEREKIGTNLPIPATPFLGRERELAEVTALLARDDARLLTLTGPGGTGKTRLAVQVASELVADYRDGVWWVPLAPLRHPQLVLESIGHVLGAKDELARHIGDKRLLLVLDNFEHLVDVAPDIAMLVTACPNLKVLVTSRELLRIRGEQAYPVPPLSADDGVELFLARARAVHPDFAGDGVVQELCERLDNLPLAIELAAARTSLFTPAQLVGRLSERLDLLKGGRDADPRQQTLRATLAWSYELLDREEQRLFAALSVFLGGCTYEAAETVAGAEADTLQSLIDKSLVRRRDTGAGPRYWMLETMHEYAEERLRETGAPQELDAEEVRRRHARWFFDVATREAARLGGPEEASAAAQLDAEDANLRAAFDLLLEEAPTDALRLAAALQGLWLTRGRLRQARSSVEAALARAGDEPSVERARILRNLAFLVGKQGDYEYARLLGSQALSLARASADDSETASALNVLAGIAMDSGDFGHSAMLYEHALELARRINDDVLVGRSLTNLGILAALTGDLERSMGLSEEARALCRAVGNLGGEANALMNLGTAAADAGDIERAHAALLEALELYRQLGNRLGAAGCLESLAETALALGNAGEAARLWASAATAHREAEAVAMPPAELERYELLLAEARAALGEPAFAAAWDAGSALSLEDAVDECLASARGPR